MRLPLILPYALFHLSLAAAYFFPAEASPHLGTLMTWPTVHSVYGSNITEIRMDIADVATAISRHEPLHLFVKGNSNNLDSARAMLGNNKNVFIHQTESVDSLWARDTGPIFVRESRAADADTSGVVLNFNEWGMKLPQTADRDTAKAVLADFDVPTVVANIISEGGALEIDGEGTLMATESSIFSKGRNPNLSKKDVESQFKMLFGVNKTIWFEGANDDITDDHVDAIARFVSPSVVVITKRNGYPAGSDEDVTQALDVLKKATDAKGRKIKIFELPEPDVRQFDGKEQPGDTPQDLTLAYVNYYVCNGAVILAGFGDQKADANAKRIVQNLYPNRVVEQVVLRRLMYQGGGIHCATQQILDF